MGSTNRPGTTSSTWRDLVSHLAHKAAEAFRLSKGDGRAWAEHYWQAQDVPWTSEAVAAWLEPPT